MAGRPSSCARIGASIVRCSSSLGHSGAARKASSVRSRPTPSAPASRAVLSSATPDTFARTRTEWPSSVTDGSSRLAIASARLAVRRLSASVAASILSDVGDRNTSPSLPSTTTGLPGVAASKPSPIPTTIGIPSERATIAAWAETPPAARAIPVTPRSSSATSAGPRSAAIRISPPPLPAPSCCASGSRPTSPAARRPTLRMSSARSASRASSIAATTSAWASAESRIAAAAGTPRSNTAARISCCSDGSRAISAPVSTISASSSRPLRLSVAAIASISAAARSSARRAVSTSPWRWS